ncbi:MAG: calcium/sodium antiporter [Prevotella sp.]|nr:calcium/sodium antiporter [Prevotella sp.]
MVINLLLIVVGIIVVLWGADRLTDGAVALAERMKLSQMVIGLTIVALGTSMPEFFVSLMSALKGTTDLAVGNVVGSNIFNAMLIVGCAALVMPMSILRSTVRKDIPFALLASIMLMLMCLDGTISRLDAALLFAALLVFFYVSLKGSKPDNSAEVQRGEPYSVAKAVMLVVIGLAGLVVGSNVFVDNASALAGRLGLSEAVIGLTIVAGGTSLPELATSIVAARKGNSGIAIGNVLGSNVMNILFILGLTGLISPMTINGITWIDLSMLGISMLLLWIFSFTKYRIERWEGAVLVAIFLLYMGSLIAGA